MILKIDEDTSFSLIPENYQDKLWLGNFMKYADENGGDKFMELEAGNEECGGVVTAAKLVSFAIKDDKEEDEFGRDIEDITQMSVNAFEL